MDEQRQGRSGGWVEGEDIDPHYHLQQPRSFPEISTEVCDLATEWIFR